MDSLKEVNSLQAISAFNNVYRHILKLPPRSSASTMYAVNHIDSFEILVRKRIVRFIKQLKVSYNSIISCIGNP